MSMVDVDVLPYGLWEARRCSGTLVHPHLVLTTPPFHRGVMEWPCVGRASWGFPGVLEENGVHRS